MAMTGLRKIPDVGKTTEQNAANLRKVLENLGCTTV